MEYFIQNKEKATLSLTCTSSTKSLGLTGRTGEPNSISAQAERTESWGNGRAVAGLGCCSRVKTALTFMCVGLAEQKRDILPSPCGTDDKHSIRHGGGIYPLPVLRRQLAPAYVTLTLQMVWMLVPQEHDKHLKRRDCLLLIRRHTRWVGRCLSISMEWKSCPWNDHSLPFHCSIWRHMQKRKGWFCNSVNLHRNPAIRSDQGAWWAIVHRVAKSETVDMT